MFLATQLAVLALSVGVAEAIRLLFKRHPSPRNDSFVIIIAALIAQIGIQVTSKIGERWNRPKVVVSTLKKTGEIDIAIRVDGNIRRIALSYPVKGAITSVVPLIEVTDAQKVLTRAIGDSTHAYLNKLEILADPMKPEVNLQYNVFYEAAPTDAEIAGTDSYEVSYQWDYDNKTFSESRWQSTDGDHDVAPPPVQIVAASIYKRALSPDEVKELYEKGPEAEKRDF